MEPGKSMSLSPAYKRHYSQPYAAYDRVEDTPSEGTPPPEELLDAMSMDMDQYSEETAPKSTSSRYFNLDRLKQFLFVSLFAFAGAAIRVVILGGIDDLATLELPSKVVLPNSLGCFIIAFANYYPGFKSAFPLTHKALTTGMSKR